MRDRDSCNAASLSSFSSMDKQKEKITGKTSAGKSEESEEE